MKRILSICLVFYFIISLTDFGISNDYKIFFFEYTLHIYFRIFVFVFFLTNIIHLNLIFWKHADLLRNTCKYM